MGIHDPSIWNGCGVRKERLTFDPVMNEKQLSMSGLTLYCNYYREFCHRNIVSPLMGVFDR